MRGFAVILVFYFAGVFLHEQLGVPVPGNVLGFALLSIALFTGLIKLRWVEGAAESLLRYMGLFFVPSMVSVMALLPIIGTHWPAITVGILGSTLATMLLTGWAVQLAIRLTQKKSRNASEQIGEEKITSDDTQKVLLKSGVE